MSFATSAALVGTLIVAAPTSEGLVIAADSLAVSPGSQRRCNFDTKIGEIAAVDRTVYALTGLSSQTRHPWLSICGMNTPHLGELDVRNAFREYVESQKKTAETISLAPFAQRLQGILNTMPADFRSIFTKQYTTRPVAQILVASYNEKTSTSIIRSAWIVIKPGGGLTITREKVERVSNGATFLISTFGERPYAELSIADGTLKKYYAGGETQRLLGTRARVGTIEKQRAANAASDVINAVSARMKVIPSKNVYKIGITVGGAVDVLFIGKEPRPEKLQWKPAFKARIADLPVRAAPTSRSVDAAAAAGLTFASFTAPRVIEASAPAARNVTKAMSTTRLAKNLRLVAVQPTPAAPRRVMTVNFMMWQAQVFRMTMPPNRRGNAIARRNDAPKDAPKTDALKTDAVLASPAELSPASDAAKISEAKAEGTIAASKSEESATEVKTGSAETSDGVEALQAPTVEASAMPAAELKPSAAE